MALGVVAGVAIPPVLAGVGTTCHQASWFWGGEEATVRGQAPARAPIVRMGNIAAIPNNAQGAMLALRRAGTWNFDIVSNALPPIGTVLLWIEGPTHSAIVTAGGISGYNQACVFPHLPALGNYSTCLPAQLVANRRSCFTIAENDLVAQAVVLGI
jgi:hypothetical protein